MLKLLLFGGGGDGDVDDIGDVGGATDDSSVSVRVEDDNKRFRKIPRNIEMGVLDLDDCCGARMLFNADAVGMDRCVTVVAGTVKYLV